MKKRVFYSGFADSDGFAEATLPLLRNMKQQLMMYPLRTN